MGALPKSQAAVKAVGKTRALFIRALCAAFISCGAVALHFNSTATAFESARSRAVLPESSAGRNQGNASRPERIEYSASRQRIGGREIAGFSVRQALAAQEEKLTASLKPVEQEAWLAMAAA